MAEDLIIILNFLQRVEVKGDSTIYLAESLVRLKNLINKEEEATKDEIQQ